MQEEASAEKHCETQAEEWTIHMDQKAKLALQPTRGA